MKRAVACVTIWFLSALLMGGITARAQDSITIAIGEWPPYMSKTLSHLGGGSRIIKEAFSLQGINVTFQFYPWKRTLALVEHNRADATGLWGYSEQRAAYAFYSDPVCSDSVYFWHLKSVPFNWNTVADLKGLIVGGTLAYNYGDDFNKAVEEGVFTYREAPEDLMNLKMLLFKRIDLFPFEGTAGAMLLKKHFTPDQRKMLVYHPKPLSTHSFFLLMSKKNTRNLKRIEQFNKGLAQLKASGKIEAYLQQALSEY